MNIISKITCYIDEEMDGVRSYIKCAYKHKDKYPQLSEVLYTLATEEYKHVELLHGQVVNLIKEVREKEDIPQIMEEIFEEKHEAYLEDMANLKNMIDGYHK